MATLQPTTLRLASGPHAVGLVLAVPFANRNAVDHSGNGRQPSFAGSPGWGTGPRGTVLRHTTNADRTTFGTCSYFSLTACTIILGMRKRDATLRATSAFGVPKLTATTDFGAFVPYSDGTVYWDWAGDGTGVTRLTVAGLTFGDDIWCFSVGPRGMEIWQNGVRRASNAATPARTGNVGVFGLANHIGGSDLVDHSVLLVYNRQRSPDAIRELSGDPWLPFRAPLSLIRVAAAIPAGTPPSFKPAWAARSNSLLGGG